MNFVRLFHTIKFLKMHQVFFHLLRKGNIKHLFVKSWIFSSKLIDVNIETERFICQDFKYSRFNNLNLEYTDYEVKNGFIKEKLYLYNYFYLNDYSDDLLIELHEQNYNTKNIFFEPYPTSLRIINSILFTKDISKIINYIYFDVKNLSRNIEYELDGNHLLENLCALSLFECISFENKYYYTKKLIECLNCQFVDFSWHYENSPMYQSILIERFQKMYIVLKRFNYSGELIFLLEKLIKNGLSTLRYFYYKNTLLNFNDSTYNASLTLQDLEYNNIKMGIEVPHLNTSKKYERLLNSSGFYIYKNDLIYLITTSSKIIASEIPGHSHSSFGTFNLIVNKRAFIVNNAISTYQNDIQRKLERSNLFHNSVTSNSYKNSHNVWSAFRIAQRSKSYGKIDNDKIHLTNKHFNGVNSSREFIIKSEIIEIVDKVYSDDEYTGYLYFHHDIDNTEILSRITSTSNLTFFTYSQPVGFNSFKTAFGVYYKFYKTNKLSLNVK